MLWYISLIFCLFISNKTIFEVSLDSCALQLAKKGILDVDLNFILLCFCFELISKRQRGGLILDLAFLEV